MVVLRVNSLAAWLLKLIAVGWATRLLGAITAANTYLLRK